MLAEVGTNLSHNLIADTFGRLCVSCHALIVTVNCHAHHRCAMTGSHRDRPTYCLRERVNLFFTTGENRSSS